MSTRPDSKICIFLPSMELGGTERRMVLLAEQLFKKGYAVEVCTLRKQGVFVEQVEKLGIPLHSIDKGGRYDLLAPFLKLVKFFKSQKYDLVLSCLPSANLYALTSKIVSRKTPLVWGLASAELPMGDYGLWARVSYIAQMLLSRFSDRVVVNSNAGKQSAVNKGYDSEHVQVIHNGVDTGRFAYSKQKADAWRKKYGIPAKAQVIGLVGRLDPAKDHSTFLKACELAYKENSELWFAIVGGGKDQFARNLQYAIKQHPLYKENEKRLVYIEQESDTSAAYSAFDISTVTSKSESLPNVLLEAMSCGNQVVVTDVGDCKYVTAGFGQICEVGDASAIAKAWISVLSNADNQQMAIMKYIDTNFSVDKMMQQFDELLVSLLTKP